MKDYSLKILIKKN